MIGMTAIKYSGEDYWKNYMEIWFGRELIDKWYEYGREEYIQSNGKHIHLEIYDSGDDEQPTIIFAHGIAGYARILLPFLIPLREKGYNIIAPDLQGFGYNQGLKGDFDWNTHVENLKDTVEYARKRFKGKIILGGASMGGPLAYAAASKFLNVDGLACWCLWDFSDKEFMRKETTTKGFTYALIPVFKLAAVLFSKARVKTYALVSYDTLTNSKEMNLLVKNDPQAGTHITIKAATSLILQSKPEIPHSDFKLPVLVVQPGADRMTPAKYSKRTFDQLGSTHKRYVELEGCEHFPTERKYSVRWAEEVDSFIKDLDS
jgi:pimeloyl-ACP methyl ester carboxylesterase